MGSEVCDLSVEESDDHHGGQQQGGRMMKDAVGGSGTQGRHHSLAPPTSTSPPICVAWGDDVGLWMMHAPELTPGRPAKRVCHVRSSAR